MYCKIIFNSLQKRRLKWYTREKRVYMGAFIWKGKRMVFLFLVFSCSPSVTVCFGTEEEKRRRKSVLWTRSRGYREKAYFLRFYNADSRYIQFFFSSLKSIRVKIISTFWYWKGNSLLHHITRLIHYVKIFFSSSWQWKRGRKKKSTGKKTQYYRHNYRFTLSATVVNTFYFRVVKKLPRKHCRAVKFYDFFSNSNSLPTRILEL